jgi:hypothetical protein
METLEDRVVPATLIEAFEPGSLSQYDTALRYRPFAEIAGAATHDGTAGLAKQDGYEWLVRGSQSAPLVQQGQLISVWVNFADIAAGRAYFGFGARMNSVDSTGLTALNSGGTLSVVLAPNSNQFLLQANPGFNHPGMPTTGSFTPGAATLGAVGQSYSANTWYRVEVAWAVGGGITARLYGSDGTTLLNTVTGSSNLYTQGGIAFRSFGRAATSASAPSTDTVFFDSVSVAPIGTSAAEMAAAGGGVSPGGVLPPDNTPPPVQFVSTVGGALVPWLYANTPADEDPNFTRDLQLRAYNGPTTAQVLGQTSNPNTLVVFSAANDSFNLGTDPLAWGGPYLGSGFTNGVPQESPVLGQYLFRQLPGDVTRLIASADPKHFYTAVGRSPQFLLPGENDVYGTGLNSNRNLFLPAATLDPVVGDLLTIDDFGPRNNDGVTTFATNRDALRGYTGGDLLLRARIADINPALNPPGTRWFMMGVLFDPGDENVSNNSRWFEVRANITGPSSVTWTTLNNPDAPAAGTANFRLIPGLQEFEGIATVVPVVTAVGPANNGSAVGAVDRIRVTFASPINPATFTAADVTSLTGPGGGVGVADVVAANAANTQFDILFASPQAAPGVYSYTFGPDIRDLDGDPLGAAFSGSFTLAGLTVQSTTPAGTNILPGQLSSVVVQFNQPVDPATVTAANVQLTGPGGAVALSGVSVVDGSNNTQIRVDFSPQAVTGAYSLALSAAITNPFGVTLTPSSGGAFVVGLGVQGVRGLTATPNIPAPGAQTVRVRFNVPLDPATFTTGQVLGLTGPTGSVGVTSVTAVSGSNNTEFDLALATPLTAVGAYTLTLGLGLRDQFGNAPDQNNNLVTGESDDTPVFAFTLAGVTVAGTTLSGQVLVGTTSARLTFTAPINPDTLPGRVVLVGPGGSVPVSGVAAVPGSNNTQFDFGFPALTSGSYTLSLADGVQDPLGNPTSAFSQTFATRLVAANPTAFENLDILGQSGTVTVIGSGDDETVAFSLGGNSFTFFGVTYNSLFVSANGLITFGNANPAFDSGAWPGGIQQPAIAAHFDDLIKSADDAAATGGMVLARVEGNRLVVQWNRVRAFNGAGGAPSVGSITFQAVLQLNTGSANGDVTLNYPSLVTQDFNAEGLSASVGVKAGGTGVGLGSDNQVTLSVNGQNPAGGRDVLVRTGQAVLIQSAARDLRVIGSFPDASVSPGTGNGRLAFNAPIDPATLTPALIQLLGAGGPIAVTSVTAVAGTNNTQFDFTFAPLAAGLYQLTLAAGVRDALGTPAAAFSTTFAAEPVQVRTSLVGTISQGTTRGRVLFNRAINPATLSAGNITVNGPGGPVAVTGVAAVDGTNMVFDFTVAALGSGSYTASFAGVQDAGGGAVPTLNSSFTVGGVLNLVAEPVAFRNIDLIGDKTLVIAAGDDVAAQINLEGSTFTFLGTTYSSLFVNSNGLITFGSATTAFDNQNLTGSPAQASIAVLWDDWVGTSGNPLLVYRIQGNELIIQWNRLVHINGGTTVTFQAILQLNSGSNPGELVFNYADVETGVAATRNGASATVGVKPEGTAATTNPNRLLVSFNAISPLVGSRQAIRVGLPVAPPPPPPPPPPMAGLQGGGFETPDLAAGTFQYNPVGSPWAFSSMSGVAANNSGFTSGNPAAPEGDQVAFLQNMGTAAQAVTLSAGTYQVRFRAAQRGNFSAGNQAVRVVVGGTVLGTFTPSGAGYETFTSASFTLAADGTQEVRLEGVGGSGDRTAFVDLVEIITATSPPPPPVGGLQGGGFEAPDLAAGAFQYNPGGSPWTFGGQAGVAANGSGFTAGNPAAPEGDQVAFIQNAGTASQTVSLAAGTYQVRLRAAQRGNFSEGNQAVRVVVGGTVLGVFTASGTGYETFTTTSFNLAADGTREVRLEGVGGSGDRTALVDFVEIIAAAPPAGGIAGGGFETPDLAAGGFQYAPGGTPWTFSTSAGVAANNSGFTSGNPSAPDGDQVAFIQNAGTATQVFNVSAGGTFAVSFAVAQRGNFNPGGPQAVRVLVDGVDRGQVTAGGSGYQTFTTAGFSLSAGQHTIVLQGLGANDATALIDGVALVTL